MLECFGRLLMRGCGGAVGRLEVVRVGASSDDVPSRMGTASDVVLVDCQSDYDGVRRRYDRPSVR